MIRCIWTSCCVVVMMMMILTSCLSGVLCRDATFYTIEDANYGMYIICMLLLIALVNDDTITVLHLMPARYNCSVPLTIPELSVLTVTTTTDINDVVFDCDGMSR